MKKYLLLIVLLMTLIPLAGYSQNETSTQFTVAGVIVDATGEPLVGTAVYVKNEPGVGVVADLDGKFKIKVTKNATLIFQSVGMKNVEMLITKNEEKLQASMTDEQKELFSRYTDVVREYQAMACLLFQNSFKFGARMMVEVMEE